MRIAVTWKMEIQVNESVLQEAVSNGVAKATTAALMDWKLQGEITKAAQEAISLQGIPELVKAELQKTLPNRVNDIVTNAVQQAIPMIEKAVALAARKMAVAMAYGVIKGQPGDYDKDGLRTWKELESATNETVEA